MNIVRLNTTADGFIKVVSTGGGGGDTPSSKWTGHADAEGLKAIGWTDEDIAYYQEHGVNWNEEDDEYHKVSEDNKALYGVLTADNISTYRARIVYLPKIDTSGMTNIKRLFEQCYYLVALPLIETHNVSNMDRAFYCCYSLSCLPPLDTTQVFSIDSMCYQCYNLHYVPPLNLDKCLYFSSAFRQCNSLVSLDITNIRGFTFSNMIAQCCALTHIGVVNVTDNTVISYMAENCYCLTDFKITAISKNLELISSAHLSKESLLYLINNEATTSAITITLHSHAYTRLANDADIVAALTNHPNISIAQ